VLSISSHIVQQISLLKRVDFIVFLCVWSSPNVEHGTTCCWEMYRTVWTILENVNNLLRDTHGKRWQRAIHPEVRFTIFLYPLWKCRSICSFPASSPLVIGCGAVIPNRIYDISSSSSDCDHNLYVGPCLLESCRNCVQNSGLRKVFACRRHQFMTSMQIPVLGWGTTCLDLKVLARSTPRNSIMNWMRIQGWGWPFLNMIRTVIRMGCKASSDWCPICGGDFPAF